MRKTRFLFLFVVFLVSIAGLYGQVTVRGTLLDQDTSEPLIGAAVVVEGTSTGATTDVDGKFSFSVEARAVNLLLSYMGYKDKIQHVNLARQSDLGVIFMEAEAIRLSDVTVTASLGISRRTPVAMSNITPQLIEEKLGAQEFLEILKTTPGVYATKGPGGFGDSKINMRGFQSSNVAVMVNGVPMNDMEWGGVYWSNWAGLSDVTSMMQTQRGLGASKVSAPSVGGSINIVTKSMSPLRKVDEQFNQLIIR